MQRRIQRSNVAIKALPTLFFAGRAMLTFQNIEAGTHITVKVSQARDKRDRKIKLPLFHVNVKLLGDGMGWIYAGSINTENGTDHGAWHLSRKESPESKIAKVFNFLHKSTADPESLRGKVNLFHEGRCCKCAMPLTHPESISTAIGPKCLKHMIETMQGFKPAEIFETAQ